MRAEKTSGINGSICFFKTINEHINKQTACVSRQQSGEHEAVSGAVGKTPIKTGKGEKSCRI